MKIIKQGNADWPHTVQNICHECGTIYVLERGDAFTRRSAVAAGADVIESVCPCCKAPVKTANPNIPRPAWSNGVSLGGKIA